MRAMSLLESLGIRSDGDAAVQGIGLRFGPPPWLVVVLLVAALAYAASVYRKGPRVSPWVRGGLAALRFGALVVLLGFLFAPVAEVQVREQTKPDALVLLDGSLSMDTRDTRTRPEELAEAAMALARLPLTDAARQRAMARAAGALRRAAATPDCGFRIADCGLDEGALPASSPFPSPQSPVPSPAFRNREVDEALKAASMAVEAGVKDGLLPPDAVGRLRAIAAEVEQVLRERGGPQGRVHGPSEASGRATRLAGEIERLNAEWLAAGPAVPDEMKPGLASVSRIALLQGILKHPELDLLGRLGEGCRLQVFRFGGAVEAIASEEAAAGPTLRPARDSDQATDLAAALRRAVAACAGRPIAGLVILTDGAATGGADPIDAAADLRAASVPLYAVGIGLPEPDDVHLRSVAVQEVAFAKDLVRVRAHVVSHGYENRSCTLSVALDGTEVASRPFVLRGGSQTEEALFNAGDAASTRALGVSVAEMPGEASTANNAVEKSLRVSDDKIKVLFIEGSPRWEYRYLRGILKRDPRIEVQFITTEGDLDVARMSREHLSRFPADRAEAFAYDLVIVGDARASTFSPGDFELLDALVRQKGGSLIFLAGKKHVAEYAATPLAELLPVWITADEGRDVGEDVYPRLTVEGEESTIMGLVPSESRNKVLWTNVRPLGWVPPISGAKPGATVLAELSDVSRRVQAFPLIAWHRCGSGKVLLVGTDRLFRLRQKVGDEYHRRFWSQAVQFLTLSRLLGENKRVRLEVARTETRAGEPVDVYANVVNEVYEPATDPGYAVRIVAQEGGGPAEELYLEPVAAMPGMFRGTYVPRREGHYRVVPAKDGEASFHEAAFGVRGLSAEQGESAMRRDLLARMAELTGGRYFSLAELPGLPEYLHAEPATAVMRKEAELWDTWIFPVAFFALAGLEWALRRRQDLA
jgi:hypothetical protein